MLTSKKINELIGVEESYKASDKLMKLLFEKDERINLFKSFLEIEKDDSYDWFHAYFQEEHADRKVKKQDFTPNAVSEILSKLVGAGSSTMDVAAGTGGITIQKWLLDRKSVFYFDYKPSMFFYNCEELSDRAIPFLLFNLAIRGMNATVLHGDLLSREVKQVYFLQNTKDDFLSFSDINIMPHTKTVEQEFNIQKWLDEPIEHIESPKFKVEPSQEVLF